MHLPHRLRKAEFDLLHDEGACQPTEASLPSGPCGDHRIPGGKIGWVA